MDKQDTYSGAREAFKTLQDVVSGMNHADEDFIAFCGCHYSRSAMVSFLRFFLESRQVQFGKDDSIDSLMLSCAAIDPRFNNIDMSCFGCNHMHKTDAEQKHCFSLNKVNECFDRSCKVKDLVLANLHITEEDLTRPVA